MGTKESTFDVIIVGAGIGGISAAIASSRLGVSTVLIEKEPLIGGTGVHSPVALVCKWRDSSGRPVNAGLVKKFFPRAFHDDIDDSINLTYDEEELLAAYRREIAGCETLAVWESAEVVEVEKAGDRIAGVRIEGAHEGWVRGSVFIDGTAEGHLSAMAGASYEFGRNNDGVVQPATVTFKVSGIDFSKIPGDPPITGIYTKKDKFRIYDAIQPLFTGLIESGGTTNARTNILCFQYPDNTSLLFNQTRIVGVDPTDSESMRRGLTEGRKQIQEFWDAVSKHPAFATARIEKISTKLGIREGRRVIGDYQLTKDDCLNEARFDDMVAACAYCIDIHNPAGAGTTMVNIPNSGYYHIPYRCLTPMGFSNLLIGSRCISGTRTRRIPPTASCRLSALLAWPPELRRVSPVFSGSQMCGRSNQR